MEILRASAGNGIVESMKIVVNNRNGSKEQVTSSITYSLDTEHGCHYSFVLVRFTVI